MVNIIIVKKVYTCVFNAVREKYQCLNDNNGF